MTPILAGVFAVLLLAGVPVAFAMVTSGVSAVMLGGNFPTAIVIQRLLQPTQSFPLLAIPFFVVAGNLMMSGAIGARLIDFARLAVGGFQGGLGQVSVLGWVTPRKVSTTVNS